jgi:hypothetical protein
LLNPNRTGTTSTDYLSDLVYELLDAHCDTIRLAGDTDEGGAWPAHLEYLRDLQRVGREALARLP